MYSIMTVIRQWSCSASKQHGCGMSLLRITEKEGGMLERKISPILTTLNRIYWHFFHRFQLCPDDLKLKVADHIKKFKGYHDTEKISNRLFPSLVQESVELHLLSQYNDVVPV